jgi:putative endonuclease
MKQIKQWVVYLLECSDKTIYTGISNDLEKRIATHNHGKGARYTKTRIPVRLIKYFKVENKSEALKLEYKIKQMSRKEKLLL